MRNLLTVQKDRVLQRDTRPGTLAYLGDHDPQVTGVFFMRGQYGNVIKIIATVGLGWEHVSASLEHRVPSWSEMCEIKDAFWTEDDCVVQYHPPKEDYVSYHPNCLHLWKPIGVELPRPHWLLVGPKA